MPFTERIVIDPKVLTGKAIVRGTRISVEFVMVCLRLAGPTLKFWRITRTYPKRTFWRISRMRVSSCLKRKSIHSRVNELSCGRELSQTRA